MENYIACFFVRHVLAKAKAEEKNTWTSSSFSQKSSPNILHSVSLSPFLNHCLLLSHSVSISDTHHQLSWLEGLDSDYHDNAWRVLMNKSPSVPKSSFFLSVSLILSFPLKHVLIKTHMFISIPSWKLNETGSCKYENRWKSRLQTQCFDLESLLSEYDGLPVIARGWAIDVALM